MAGRTTWSIISVQKSIKQVKSKETCQSPLQDRQYSEGSGTDGLQGLRQVQSSLPNPRKVPLQQAFQVISPTSSSDGKPQGWYPTPGLYKGSICKICSHLYSKELCGTVWCSTHACIQPLPFPQRYFKPTPDHRASITSSTKPECNRCAYQVSWLREGKHEHDSMPAFTKPGGYSTSTILRQSIGKLLTSSQEWQGVQEHMTTRTL